MSESDADSKARTLWENVLFSRYDYSWRSAWVKCFEYRQTHLLELEQNINSIKLNLEQSDCFGKSHYDYLCFLYIMNMDRSYWTTDAWVPVPRDIAMTINANITNKESHLEKLPDGLYGPKGAVWYAVNSMQLVEAFDALPSPITLIWLSRDGRSRLDRLLRDVNDNTCVDDIRT